MRKFYYIHEGYNGDTYECKNQESLLKNIEDYDFLGNWCDDGWSPDVEHIVAGVAPYKCVEEKHLGKIEEDDFYNKHATHITEKIDERKRPDNLREDDYEDDGTHWGDFDYICNYTFVPVEPPKTSVK